ncbi:ABC transporter substrate-binding protein [Candidatus Enterovibrio altilux]|uniref:L-proline glycine betaine binding ABC transporter protein ProX n=1 Tax=Candidatus Enterovibrio altilux TaxID=1927128 RepID=A0A291BAW4_9GAMM|nr:ABC transporter substrate-binding protein [Candidatus Enterovibrio luxaltus]ATF10121.1 L-proline glycine betaine binding ABC transporter protein ProX [Candidatus Enterovibrio luxaltus]
MKKLLTTSVLLLAVMPVISFAAECANVTIADMNWNSATLIANIDRFILVNGYDCNAELVPGDTMPTGISMIEKGKPDIAPEFWSNGLKTALDRGVDEGHLRYVGKVFSEGGIEGFWVPQYLVDKDPSLATIEGVIINAKFFQHPENPSKAAFYGCPAGWSCQISSNNLFAALNLKNKGFELIDPGSGAGLSGSIAKAYERREGWFGYYWAPTAVLGKYKMVKVDFGSGIDKEHFKTCTIDAECLDPKVTMYPPAAVDTVITESFAQRAPKVVNYLANRSFDTAELNLLLAWMEKNQADGEIASEYFLNNHADVWMQWVSPEIAQKVKSAL